MNFGTQTSHEFPLSPAAKKGAAERDELVIEVMNLWTKRQLLKNEKPSLSWLNDFINRRFSVTGGIDSLAWESFPKIIAILEAEIKELAGKPTGLPF